MTAIVLLTYLETRDGLIATTSETRNHLLPRFGSSTTTLLRSVANAVGSETTDRSPLDGTVLDGMNGLCRRQLRISSATSSTSGTIISPARTDSSRSGYPRTAVPNPGAGRR